MARERISGGSTSFQNIPPPTSHRATPKATPSSRIPVSVKPRAILGERIENFDQATPRQHVVKPVKSVSRVTLVSSTNSKPSARLQSSINSIKAKPKSPSRLQSSTQSTVAKAKSPAQLNTSLNTFSSPATDMATPAGANTSRPGHTPHPRRSSVGLGQLMNGDDTMLMDLTGRDFLISDSETSEVEEEFSARERGSGRGVIGAGRLMTPENSQETRGGRVHERHTSPSRQRTRFPTPPSSQADPVSLPVLTKSLVRPRPAPTPPRATSSARLNQSLAPPSQNPSPNPRRRKSPRPDGEDTARLRSPFDPVDASESASPRDRVEIVLGKPRKSIEKGKAIASSSTPLAMASKGRKSVTKTPKRQSLSKSTTSRAAPRNPPATAPPAQRRKSAPRQSVAKKSSPRASLSKTKAKYGRQSLPASKSSRKSITPGEVRAMGIMPVPIEQGSPSEDPLLLVEDDETSWGTPSASVRPQTRVRSINKSSKMAKVIDFDTLRAQIPPTSVGDDTQIEASGSGSRPGFYDFQVPLAGSEPDYEHDESQMWGNESDGGSDMDVGNDTFVHVTGARSPMMMIGEQRPRMAVQPTNGEDRSRSVSPLAQVALADETLEEESGGDTTILAGSPSLSAEDSTQIEHDTTIRAGSVSESPSPSSPVFNANENSGNDAGERILARSPSPVLVESAGDLEVQSVGLAESPVRSERHAFVVSELVESRTSESGHSPVGSISPGQSEHDIHSTENDLDESEEEVYNESVNVLATPSAAHDLILDSTTPAYSPGTVQSRHASPATIAGSPTVSPITSVARSSKASPGRTPRLVSLIPSSPTPVELRTESHQLNLSTTPVWSPPTLIARVSSPVISRFGIARSSSTKVASPSPASTPRAAAATVEVGQSPMRTASRNSVSASPAPASESAVGALGLFLHHSDLVEEVDISIPKDDGDVNDEDDTVVDDALAEYDESLGAGALQFESQDSKDQDQSSTDHAIKSPSQSTTPTAPLPEPLLSEVMSSPRVPKSPLPDLVDDLENDVADEVDGTVEAEDGVEESPLVEEVSTTPTAPLPSRLGFSPSHYPLAFSPRYASPLRTVQARLPSPTPAPTPARSVMNDGRSTLSIGPEPEQEFEECPSADITFEGNSADWSSSDEENQDEEAQGPEKEVDHPDVKDDAALELAIEGDDELVSRLESDDSVEEEVVSEQQDQDQQQKSTPKSTKLTVSEPESDSPEASLAADTTLEEANSFESDSEERLADEQTETDPDDNAEAEQEHLPESAQKIVLKVRNIGTVKIEPLDDSHTGTRASPTPASTDRSISQAQEERSTTPAYDPPRSRTPARQAVSQAPESLESSVQESLSPSHSASPSPAARHLSLNDDDHHEDDAVFLARSSARPRSKSRLSRQPTDVDDDVGEQSIRVRSKPSLGEELYLADDSMRSVVEVSSMDPKAAARAAAILKMNHKYIEHGISHLEKSYRTPTPGPSTYQDRSKHIDKTELLLEAELEIVSTRRSRSRSMSRFRGVSEAPTDLALPGAWNGTPKRKRPHAGVPQHETAQEVTKVWGVSQWKKLEKVFRAERELWTHEREIKQMPGGFLGWARMSTFGSPAPTMKIWDPIRVVDRFCTEQGITSDKQVGDYSVEMLRTRVEALERHAEYRKSNPVHAKDVDVSERSPKKSRVETPIKKTVTVPPPSGLRKMFGWALPSSTPKSTAVVKNPIRPVETSEEPQTTPSRSDLKGKGKSKEVIDGNVPAKDSLDMSQIGSVMVSKQSVSYESGSATPITSALALPQHPSSPLWRTTLPALPITTNSLLSSTRPTPKTLSAILAASSSSTSSTSLDSSTTARLYPSLNPPMSQRSTALNALFTSGSKSSESPKNAGMPIKRNSSVKDLVKSFEDSGALSKSLGK